MTSYPASTAKVNFSEGRKQADKHSNYESSWTGRQEPVGWIYSDLDTLLTNYNGKNPSYTPSNADPVRETRPFYDNLNWDGGIYRVGGKIKYQLYTNPGGIGGPFTWDLGGAPHRGKTQIDFNINDMRDSWRGKISSVKTMWDTSKGVPDRAKRLEDCCHQRNTSWSNKELCRKYWGGTHPNNCGPILSKYCSNAYNRIKPECQSFCNKYENDYPQCDSALASYCSSSRGKNDNKCRCFNMKNFSDGTPIPNWFSPPCHDAQCRAPSSYKDSSMKSGSRLVLGCASVIDCSQQLIVMGKEHELSGIKMEQNCSSSQDNQNSVTTPEGTTVTNTPMDPDVRPLPKPSMLEQYWNKVEDLVPLQYKGVNKNVDLTPYGVQFKSPAITWLMVIIFVLVVILAIITNKRQQQTEQAKLDAAIAAALQRQDNY